MATQPKLPKSVYIPKKILKESKENDDAIGDYLSDKYGYCIFSYNNKKIGNKHYANKINWDDSE